MGSTVCQIQRLLQPPCRRSAGLAVRQLCSPALCKMPSASWARQASQQALEQASQQASEPASEQAHGFLLPCPRQAWDGGQPHSRGSRPAAHPLQEVVSCLFQAHRVFIPRPGSRERNKPRSEQRPGPTSPAQLWLLKEQLSRARRWCPTDRSTSALFAV